MLCVQNYKKYPCILQSKDDWCIPASIENLMKFFGVDITQKQINDFFEKEHGTRDMSLAVMADIMRGHYKSKFDFQALNHENPTALLQYIEDRISKDNIPVIVSIINPNHTAHMLTVLCIDKDITLIFDSAGRPKPMRWPRHELINLLNPGLGTLIVNPL